MCMCVWLGRFGIQQGQLGSWRRGAADGEKERADGHWEAIQAEFHNEEEGEVYCWIVLVQIIEVVH